MGQQSSLGRKKRRRLIETLWTFLSTVDIFPKRQQRNNQRAGVEKDGNCFLLLQPPLEKKTREDVSGGGEKGNQFLREGSTGG